MNRITGVLFLSVAAALISVPSFADDAKLRKSLTANYASISAAFKKQDVKTMGEYMTPDFTANRPGGQVLKRDEILADFERQVKSMKNASWVRTIEALTVEGDNAIVTVRGKMTGTVADAQGKSHKMEFDAKAKDTWTKAGKGWKLKKTDLLDGKMLLDGKEMPAR